MTESLEQRITAERQAYLVALRAGHEGEAEAHEAIVDDLLDQLHDQKPQAD